MKKVVSIALVCAVILGMVFLVKADSSSVVSENDNDTISLVVTDTLSTDTLSVDSLQ